MSLTVSYPKETKIAIVIIGMLALLVSVFLFSLTVGAVPISAGQVLTILFNHFGITIADVTPVQETVFLTIRLPRLVQTIIIGGALGVSGAALQGLFRNPLVEPGLVGVSSGAALAAVIFIVFGKPLLSFVAPWLQDFLLPLIAFGGGLTATLMVYSLSQQYGKTHVALLILAGVAVIALSQAFVGLSVFYADENQARAYTFWTLGDLGGATWTKILLVMPLIVIPCIILLSFSRALNAMAVGETDAFYMGVNVERMKMTIIICTALSVGTAVSLTGTIGFVGLIVPHMMRMAFGADHRIILPASVLGGASLLMIADIFARTIVQPSELPIGIVTAILGTPFLIYLIRRAKSKHQV